MWKNLLPYSFSHTSLLWWNIHNYIPFTIIAIFRTFTLLCTCPSPALLNFIPETLTRHSSLCPALATTFLYELTTLGTLSKWNRTISLLSWLAYVTEHDIFNIKSWCGVCQNLLPFKTIIFLLGGMWTHTPVYLLIHQGTLELLPPWSHCEQRTMLSWIWVCIYLTETLLSALLNVSWR